MNRLKALRAARGLNQAQLGKMLNCTDVTISRYETGQRGMDCDTIAKLCEIFACSADYLLGLSDLPRPDLSDEEAALLFAWRRSDERAQDMVRLALAPFRQEKSDKKAI